MWSKSEARRTKIHNVAVRIVATGGDSIVFEVGPFESILRRGETVRTRTTGHYHGDAMTGTIEAYYASGDTLHEKTTATRKK